MTKEIHIRGINRLLYNQLADKAAQRNLSVNQYSKAILERTMREESFDVELFELSEMRQAIERNTEMFGEMLIVLRELAQKNNKEVIN